MASLIPKGLDLQHIERLSKQISLVDGVALAEKLAAISATERTNLNTIIGKMQRFGLDHIKWYFIECSISHFKTSLEICTQLDQENPKFNSSIRRDYSVDIDGLLDLQAIRVMPRTQKMSLRQTVKQLGRSVTESLRKVKCRLHEVPTEKSSPINDQRAQAEACGENCAADLDRQHRTSATATGLEARLNELPTEILDLVRDAFFDQKFGPKEVLAPSSIPDVRLFGAMNKKLYAKYHDIFLSGNTWVIETGNFDTTDFLLHIPGRMRQKIHKVAIRLSPEDISYASIDSWLRGHPDLVKRSFGDFSNVLYEFYKDCREINDMLYSVWSGKLTDIFKLSESVHLTLDMRDAYGIDGEYLGLRLAHRLARWFQDDDDAPLTVRVPNGVLGEQLRNAIGDNVKYLDEQVVMNTNLE